jgi:hypothetical protein
MKKVIWNNKLIILDKKGRKWMSLPNGKYALIMDPEDLKLKETLH